MGGISTRNFVRRTDIEGQGKEVLLHAKGMHMTNYHLHRLFHEFNKLAGDSGLVDIDEFFMFYNIPENVLLYFLFQQFELTKRGSINFDQYLITLWNLLTMQHDDMAIFMYTAFNPTELSSIDVDEVKYMIKVLYGFPKKPPEIMKNVFKKLALNKNGVITLVEFVLLSRHHKALFKPFHDLKKMIRKHVVHTRYWREQGWKRRKFNRGKSIYEVIDSFDPLFVKRNLEWLSTCRNTPPEEVAIWRAARSRQDKEVVVDVHNIHNEHLTPHQLSLKKILPPPPKFKRRFALVESTVKLYKSRYSSFGLGSENSDGDSDYEDTDYSESDNVSELSSFSGNSNSRFNNNKQKLKKNKKNTKSGKHSELMSTFEDLDDDDDDNNNEKDDENKNTNNDKSIISLSSSSTLNKENLLRQQELQPTNNDNDDEKEEKKDIDDDERSFSSKKGYFGGRAIFPVLKPINI